MNKTAIIFPGQGSQYIGMGLDFYGQIRESKRVYEETNSILGMDFSNLIFKGTEEEINKTTNTQPAILATSIAILRAIQKEGVVCEYTAGLSLGEYSSMVLSGAMEYKDAIQIVRKRGEIMQQAVPMGIGGMVAVLGLERSNIGKIITEASVEGIIEIANYNSPEQVVLTGEIKAIRKACEVAIRMGAKRAIELSVSAPFHSSLLIGAGEQLREELMRVDVYDARVEIVTNVDGNSEVLGKNLRAKLVEQVSKSVLWQQSIEYMLDAGVGNFIEVGPGRALTGFVKRISKAKGKEVKTYSIRDIESYKTTMREITV